MVFIKASPLTRPAAGDVKPGNFCLKAEGALSPSQKPRAGSIKAIDFGCSQSIGTRSQARRLSKRSGTPAFMSPEIFKQVRASGRGACRIEGY